MPDSKIDILLQIRSDLNGLKKAQVESQKLSNLLKNGFGAGIGLGASLGVANLAREFTQAIGAGVRFNAMVETQTVAFRTLLGSVKAADERIKSLITFAATTPFELGEVTQANKLLQALTGGALATEEGMRLVGDAAAAVGVGFKDAAFWIGRLYSGLEGGAPIGEAATRLQEMGIVSSTVRAELNDLSGKALGSSESFALMGRIFGETAGAMELQSQTLTGRFSTLKDGINQLLGSLTGGVTRDLSAVINLLNILLGNSQTETEKARAKIISLGAELRRLGEEATTEQVSDFLKRLSSESEVASSSVAEIEERLKKLADLEIIQKEIVGTATAAYQGSEKNVERLVENQKEQEILKAQLEEQKRLLKEIGDIRARTTTPEAVEQQAANSEALALANAENEKKETILRLTKEATKENEKLAESVKRLYEQYNVANLTDNERLSVIAERLRIIEAETNEEFKQAEIIEDAAQKKAVLDNIEYKAELKRIPLLNEQLKLEEKVKKAEIDGAKESINLKNSQLERELDQIEHLKELAKLEGNSATTRLKIAGLVGQERYVLQDLIDLWKDYAATVTDPALKESIEGKLQSLEQRSDRTGEALPLSRAESSQQGFDELRGKSNENNFRDVTSAATAALQDYAVQVGTVYDDLHENLIRIQEDLSGGIAESIEGLIRGTVNWSKAFENVGEAILNSVITAFASMLANWITTQLTMLVLSKVFGKSAAGSSATQAVALAEAWAPAATAASIATFGVAAGVGTAAFVAGLGAASLWSIAFAGAGAAGTSGFAEGGFTGPGGKYDVAGTVHAGEFVMPADVVGKTGPGYFYDQMKDIRSGSGKGGSGGGSSSIAVFDSRKSAERWAESQSFETRVIDIMESNKGMLI
jgi:hypothetical protein